MQEGVFRFKELKKLMIERNIPTNKVTISEDGTVVNGRIQYDAKTNQIVGFVLPLKNGLPVSNSYPATSAKEIETYFKNGIVSKNAYIIMARPLSLNSTPFCVGMFGTDNRFSHLDVLSRWEWMHKEAAKEELEILAHSSDGDSKLLKAMYLKIFSAQPNRKWPWLNCSLENPPIAVMVQDTIHLLVKLKCKLLHASDIMPMGKHHIVSRGHVAALIDSVSKDKHDLTSSLLDQKDKMNFKAAQKLSHVKVCEELKKIPGSDATVTFLTMMREFCSAYLDVTLDPCERIFLVFKWLFFLRLWRKWIEDTDGYSLQHNFITANAYTCMEINAHSLILMLRKFRDSEEHKLFLPWLFSSQDCEDAFRRARAMSPIGSTMATFSILDLQHRMRRIDFLSESFNNLQSEFEFPRLKKLYVHKQEQPHVSSNLPEDYEVEEIVKNAFQSALQECKKYKIAKQNTSKFPVCPLQSVLPEDIDNEPDADIDGHTTSNGEDTEPLILEDPTNDEDAIDVEEDLLVVCTGSLGLKCFENVTLIPTGPFVKVADGNGKLCLIKKSSLVWLLSSGDTRISSDRLLRVQSSEVHHGGGGRIVPDKHPFKDDTLSIGHWYVFLSEDNSLIVGRVLAFSYLSGSTWREQTYSKTSAPVEAPNPKTKRGLGCLCDWYQIQKNGKLQNVSMDVHGYYPVEKYVCTLPRPNVNKNQTLQLPCPLKEIKTFLSSTC